jgi:hypothetical protein
MSTARGAYDKRSKLHIRDGVRDGGSYSVKPRKSESSFYPAWSLCAISVKPVAKRVKGLTKADLVKAISEKVGAESLEGLEKAPAITLGKLLECL